ncbi:HAD family hydrolase [Roseiconus nitratireducens]|uniref:HAD family hydrolase n=1 Tax=Roseiconus nitratireducens TaxID=2605748 RepID=UPI0013759218|nr:HAD family hydrolase [Roseiconus nitratireducens]
MARRTLFFDIDGTLLLTRRAGRSALHQAMREEFGLAEVDDQGIRFGGRTDRELVAAFLRTAGIDPSPLNQGRLRRRYVSAFRQAVRSTPGGVLPGVLDLIRELSQHSQVRLAVMTGNFPETARMKLECFGLLEYFSWIVGGDLDASRCDLARRAAARLIRRGGGGFTVIGDTVHDVRCARAIDARCLAVCTGSGTREELEREKADHIVDDLTDQSALAYLLQA